MSLSGFQRAWSTLIASPELCLQLRDAVPNALEEFDLTPLERRRLEAAVRQRGMSTNLTLWRLNRVTPLYVLLPLTRALLGEDFARLVARYWQGTAPKQQLRTEVRLFAQFVLDHPNEWPRDVASFVREILSYEVGMLDICFRGRAEPFGNMVPAEEEGRCLVRFLHDPSEVLRRVSQSESLRDFADQESWVELDGSKCDVSVRAVPSADHSAPSSRVQMSGPSPIGRVSSPLQPGVFSPSAL
jgi:hypothetical protein